MYKGVAITLEYKGIDYDIEYIDLANPPEWFLAISPLKKVPLLIVDGTVIFESAVINEYIDEVIYTNASSTRFTDESDK